MKTIGRFRQILLYTVLFMLIVTAGYAGLWINGKTYVWYRDGVDQYLPGMLYMGQYLREILSGIIHGAPVLPMYDLSVALGEDIIGSMNYYGLGEPLNLLALFSDQQNGTVFYTVLFFLRMYLAGISFLAFSDYLRLHRLFCVGGALMYIFSGFAVYGGGMYAAWVTVLIYFPLLLLGAEMVFRKDRRAVPVLILSVAYGALCGFYYLYMCGLSLAVYCIVRLYFILRKEGEIFSAALLRSMLLTCLKCLGLFFLGLGIASPVLLPSLLIVGNSDRTGFPIYYVVFNYHNYIPKLNDELMASLLHPRNSQMSYLGGLTLLEILSFFGVFFLKKGRKKNQLLLLALTILISLHFPIITCLFNAFADTYNRWVFLIHFSLAVISVCVLQELSEKCRQKRLQMLLVPTVLCITSLNIILNLTWLFTPAGSDWEKEYLTEAEAEQYIGSPVNESGVIRSDPELFRISKESNMVLNERPENTAMLNQYNGIVYFLSMINGHFQRFAKAVNKENDRWRCYGLNRDSVFESAAGVKYHLTKHPEMIPRKYEKREEVTYFGETWYVFENPGFAGMVYLREPPSGEALLDDGKVNRAYYESVLASAKDQSPGTVTDLSLAGNKLSFTADASEDCEAMILLGLSPGWQAFLDGQKAELSEADILGMSLNVPAGEHTVVLKYRTPGLMAGCILFLLSLLLWIGITVYRNHSGALFKKKQG